MRMEIALFTCLLLAGCGAKDFQYADPDDTRADFQLDYAEYLPGVAVNLDGYRNNKEQSTHGKAS